MSDASSTPAVSRDDIQRVLQERFGFEGLRPGQEQVIDDVLGGAKVIAVMPTGAGKSLCYQLPAVLLSEHKGVSLVVSPLIALMKDQVDGLCERGIRAAALTSAVSSAEQADILSGIARGDYSLVYVAPERFHSSRFLSALREMKGRLALLAIDEAHCISEWGHEFRPAYRMLGEAIKQLEPPRLMAVTATATPSVRKDIADQLGLRSPTMRVRGFARPEICFAVEHTSGSKSKGKRLVEMLGDLNEGSALVYAATRKNAERYAELSEDYRKVTVRSINLNGVFQPGLVLIGNVCVAVVLLFGGFRVLSGELAVGVLLALILSTKRFFQPVDQMAMFYNSFQSAQAALEKVSGLLEEVPTVRPPKNPVALPEATGRIDFENVEFRYGDGPVIIPAMDLHIPAGQTVALVGQTGAGKSTLAKLIARFYDVSSGSLTLDGVDLRQLSTADLRRNVVMVTQEAFLFSGSVADNIALGRPEASRDEIEDAAKAVGAHEFIMALPDGYDTDVNKRGGRVSAGQRQLISFARAFLARPAVLILDEATSSLDIPSERMVQAGLASLLQGVSSGEAARTALIIAHRLSTVETADRVLVVHDGRVVEDGTPAELIGGGGRFAKLHGAWKDSLV